jgi:hypothetical protein
VAKSVGTIVNLPSMSSLALEHTTRMISAVAWTCSMTIDRTVGTAFYAVRRFIAVYQG